MVTGSRLSAHGLRVFIIVRHGFSFGAWQLCGRDVHDECEKEARALGLCRRFVHASAITPAPKRPGT
eukprot:883673-Rhodomonas_salina.1